MTPRALIFDVDGTLAETEEAHRQAFNDTFAAAGLDWHWTVADYTSLLKTTGGKERMRAHRAAIGAATPTDQTIAALHRTKTARYAEILAKGGLHLRDGVQALMDWGRAQGLRLAIATTTSRANVEALTQAIWGEPADRVFDVLACGDEVAAKKPAPDVYRLALERLGLSPESAIALEDSQNGVMAAKRAGLRVAVVPSTYTAAEEFITADWRGPSWAPSDQPWVLAQG